MNIMLNFAISADGKIGTYSGGASKFTSRCDLERLWEIRTKADAILVGRGTLEADNMSMTIPLDVSSGKQPLRLIVSRKGEFNFAHPVFHKAGGEIHLLSTEQIISDETPASITTHHMSLDQFLDYCRDELGTEHLLCEGGGQLARSLSHRVTEIHLTIAGHTLIGGKGAPCVLGRLSEHLPSSRKFHLTHFESLESEECFLSYAAE